MTDSQKEGRFGSEFTLVTNIRMNNQSSIILTGRKTRTRSYFNLNRQSNSNREQLGTNRESIRHFILQRGSTGRS